MSEIQDTVNNVMGHQVNLHLQNTVNNLFGDQVSNLLNVTN
jgi:hypothetical protein